MDTDDPLTNKHPSVTLDRVMSIVARDDYEGICLACGEDAYNVEPDAREYPCDVCGASRVYGAQEILVMMA